MGGRVSDADLPRTLSLPLSGPRAPLAGRRLPLPAVALLLSAAAWIVYSPALNRVFVADQLWYFAELGGSTSLADGLRHYDYAATRRYWKGDDALFRPLLFVWLAVLNAAFTYHHAWWNLASLMLHALVGLALYRLLVRIAPAPFAFGAALLFVVLQPQVELVIWNHLGGYLLAALLLVIGLQAFAKMAVAERAVSSGEWVRYALAFTAAALCHEAMVVAAVIAALTVVHVWRRRGRRVPAAGWVALAAPPFVFATLYGVHAARVSRLLYVDRPDGEGILGLANLARAAPATVQALGHWSMEVLVPTALTFGAEPYLRLVKSFTPALERPLQAVNVVVAITLVGALVSSTSREHLRRVAPLLVVVGGALLAYAAIICLGRSAQEAVSAATYYLYLFSVLALVLAYAVVDPRRLTGLRRAAAAISLGVFLLLHAAGTRAVTAEVGRVNAEASRYLKEVARFVDAYRHDPEFTFAIAKPRPHVDPEVRLREGYPDERDAPEHVRRVTEILFSRYYTTDRPKYVLP